MPQEPADPDETILMLIENEGACLAARLTTIFGDSTEIMRNVLARSSLGLPK